jgi:hypothetical protein
MREILQAKAVYPAVFPRENQLMMAMAAVPDPKLAPRDSSSTGTNQTSVQRTAEVVEELVEELVETPWVARPALRLALALLDSSPRLVETQPTVAAWAPANSQDQRMEAEEMAAPVAKELEPADRFFVPKPPLPQLAPSRPERARREDASAALVQACAEVVGQQQHPRSLARQHPSVAYVQR